jgi:DNA-binding beta-propeller fold protein YncE
MRRTLPICNFLAAFFVVASLPPAQGASTAANPLVLESRMSLGVVEGRIDHLSVDLARQRLFVAELGNGSVGVVDLREGKLLRQIDGLQEPQGVSYDPGSDTVYVASAGDGTLRRYSGADFAPRGVTKLGEDADNVRLDHPTGQVVVGYGDGALALIDAASGTKNADITLAAHPESIQIGAGDRRIFVNVPEARQVAVVDKDAGQQVATWKLEGRGNFAMALDEAGARLLIVDRDPAELLVLDTASGARVARVATCGDADDIFLDAQRQRVYVSCGEGFLDVVQRHGDIYGDPVRIPTAPGARTALFVAELDRLFLAVRAGNRQRAEIWVFRPTS